MCARRSLCACIAVLLVADGQMAFAHTFLLAKGF
jgi:hypothetical protein